MFVDISRDTYRSRRVGTRWPSPSWTADTCSCPSRVVPRCWWSTWPPSYWRPLFRCWSPWHPYRSLAPVCCSGTRICNPDPSHSAGSRTSGSPSCPPSRGCPTRPWSRSLALRETYNLSLMTFHFETRNIHCGRYLTFLCNAHYFLFRKFRIFPGLKTKIRLCERLRILSHLSTVAGSKRNFDYFEFNRKCCIVFRIKRVRSIRDNVS